MVPNLYCTHTGTIQNLLIFKGFPIRMMFMIGK